MGYLKETENKIKRIRALKKDKNALLLAHNYQRPEIFEIADFIGDSLELSKHAAQTTNDIIVFCGVHFMAETAKLLNPNKKVLLPNLAAGCSLADSVSPADISLLRAAYPEAAIVCYVNTSAAVKAACDICCTSSNATEIVNALPQEHIVFVPDRNLGNYVAQHTHKKITIWEGNCSIHHTLNRDKLQEMKIRYPDAKIIAHPECRDEILKIADYVCSTGKMAKAAKDDDASQFIVVTECGMTQKMSLDMPDKDFIGFCNICPFMKATTLDDVINSLLFETHCIEIDKAIFNDAHKTVQRMMDMK